MYMDSTTNQKSTNIQDIFQKHLKIEPKVVSIEALFGNERRLKKTTYDPPYQRNYVWDDEKATYFIESILLGTEIPPIIFFNTGKMIEVIDGRQRYQTIKRFIDKEFKLKKGGLLKLKDLGNQDFDELNDLKDTFWDTKLRIIEFSFSSKELFPPSTEDIIKKEIFKRYNSGITPLKSTDIDKAKYLDDDINKLFKDKLIDDIKFNSSVVDVFHLESNANVENTLKKIRQFLVLHKIPISYYSAMKDKVITKFYEHLSDNLSDVKVISNLLKNFEEKIETLSRIKKQFKVSTNRLIFECILWAFSVLDEEGISPKEYSNPTMQREIVDHISKHIDYFKQEQSSFAKELNARYQITADFFQKKFNVDFTLYLYNHQAFKEKNRKYGKVETDVDSLSQFESLRLNKPDASSNTIDDICLQMKKQRFLIRPPYQRKEVINQIKSSGIIESILLGIKIPPIFIYKREDGISEVLDGQQRLLSILGFIGNEYLNEEKKFVKSDKNKYSLRLKNGILKNLEGKKYEDLDDSLQDRILDYDLWVVEISEKNNPNFDPIDLFIRLNYKPYPIKENTFEMWNSYVDRDIIKRIKKLSQSHEKWFYVRKNNKRMENEDLLTFLTYIEYRAKSPKVNATNIVDFLDIYGRGGKINFRIKSKQDITKVLTSPNIKEDFINSCSQLETNFIDKVKELLSENDNTSEDELSARFNKLFGIDSTKRTFQNFYALWYILVNINISSVRKNKQKIRDKIFELYSQIKNENDKDKFDKRIEDFWQKYNS
ncbi:MAG TPA: DUF262 domain-containing protein [Microscillaceae bacterium]|nr:DUF262 domain-containing protein [Microscillaceae bacterium]